MSEETQFTTEELPLATARRHAAEAPAGDKELDAAVARLAALSPLAYDRVRVAEAERMGVRAATLDDAVAAVRKRSGAGDGGQGRPLVFERPKPWDTPVDGAALFDELCDAFARYMALPEGAKETLALWTLHTFVFQQFEITPRLFITSAEKQSGKTRTLLILKRIVAKPLLAAHVTPAAMFRTLALAQPTLLVDEADTFVPGNNDLKGVINSGHTSEGQFIRTTGDDHEPRAFATWAPLAIAAIGEVQDTVMDRSVVVPLRRRRPDEPVARFRAGRTAALSVLARKCERFAQDGLARVGERDVDCPEWMSDRAADNWRVLFAIAEALGPVALAAALKAARALTPQTGAAPSDGTMLLEDIARVFEERDGGRIASAELVAALVAREDRPWPEWRHGQALTTRQLAKLLEPFEIRPRVIWQGVKSSRGYMREDFDDAFARYLPAPSVRASEPTHSAGLRVIETVRPRQPLTDETGANASNGAASYALTASAGEAERGRMKPGMRE